MPFTILKSVPSSALAASSSNLASSSASRNPGIIRQPSRSKSCLSCSILIACISSWMAGIVMVYCRKCQENAPRLSWLTIIQGCSMNQLVEHKLSCPYCGESILVLIDTSVERQEYVEDCQVCCRPIGFDVSIPADSLNGEIDVMVSHENE